MSKIMKIRSREILDSRGNPTVEADVFTNRGISRASVPSGASTGKYEAYELRDGGRRYLGKGVLKAVSKVNNVMAKKIIGQDCTEQKEADELMIELDGALNKSNLGPMLFLRSVWQFAKREPWSRTCLFMNISLSLLIRKV